MRAQLGKAPLYQTSRAVPVGDLRLSAALNARVHDIASNALDIVAPAHRTVAAEIIVSRFVERFAAAVASANWAPLLAFVEVSCQRYAGILPVSTLMSVALDATCDLLGGVPNSGLASSQLAQLRADIESLTARPRLVEPAHREAIDEIDVALDDLITRLDQSDELTAEHSRAVSAWCAQLAERLSLSKQDTIEIARRKTTTIISMSAAG